MPTCPNESLVQYEGCPEGCQYFRLTPAGGWCVLEPPPTELPDAYPQYPGDWEALLVLYVEAHPEEIEVDGSYPIWDCDTYLRWGEEEGLIDHDEAIYFCDCIRLEIEEQEQEEGPDWPCDEPAWGQEDTSEATAERRKAQWDRYYDGQDLPQ